MKSILLIILMSVFTSTFAIDLSQYELTELQIELMVKFKKRGFDDEKLHKIASAFHRANLKEDKEEYIPPYEEEDLMALRNWAMGDVFYIFRKEAGVTFDKEAYVKDCPNWPLFGFLKATGTEHINFEVMHDHINMMFALDYALKNKDAEMFKEIYLKYAEDAGFLKYMQYNP